MVSRSASVSCQANGGSQAFSLSTLCVISLVVLIMPPVRYSFSPLSFGQSTNNAVLGCIVVFFSLVSGGITRMTCTRVRMTHLGFLLVD